MTPTDQCPLLRLPNEILILIFHESACITDTWSLAQTCAQLYGLFALRRNKVDILRSAVDVPKRPIYDEGYKSGGIMRIPPHSWAFPSAEYSNTFILSEFDYGPAAEFQVYKAMTMCDLVLLQTHRMQTGTFIDGMHDFLSQFQELDQRWRGQFELATEHMLAVLHNSRVKYSLIRLDQQPFPLTCQAKRWCLP
ncbi:hypothetical protein BDV12DRAFT_176760 [Aspergillus spectabilis]